MLRFVCGLYAIEVGEILPGRCRTLCIASSLPVPHDVRRILDAGPDIRRDRLSVYLLAWSGSFSFVPLYVDRKGHAYTTDRMIEGPVDEEGGIRVQSLSDDPLQHI